MCKLFGILLSALLLATPIFAQEKNVKLIQEKTQAKIRELVTSTPGAMGLALIDLNSGERFGINDQLVFPQASAIKIVILMEVYKQAHEGKFKLSDIRKVEHADKTAGSGILVELGDGSVQLSIHDLCVLMILVSDNTATNMLIDLVGRDNINKTLASLGFKETRLKRRMLDTAASIRGDENVSTPAEAAEIMRLLYKGEFINREICDHILAILKKGKKTNIKEGLPEDVVLATKPGGIAGVTTEWAVVLLKDRPYVLVVMENYGVEKAGPETIKEISKTLYEYFSRLAKATPHGTYVAPPRPAPTK